MSKKTLWERRRRGYCTTILLASVIATVNSQHSRADRVAETTSQTEFDTFAIDEALKYIIKNRPALVAVEIKGEGKRKLIDVKEISTPEEFLKQRPNCCTVRSRGQEGMVPSWMQRFRYGFKAFVEVKDELQLIAPDDNPQIDVESMNLSRILYVPIDRHGHPIPELDK